MNRETALKYKDVLMAWLDGKEIEFRPDPRYEWHKTEPNFISTYEYRIKPIKVTRWIVVLKTKNNDPYLSHYVFLTKDAAEKYAQQYFTDSFKIVPIEYEDF